jgi:predicted kinase
MARTSPFHGVNRGSIPRGSALKNMKKLIVGIGIPGSGKTTILKKIADKNGYVYISTDELRTEITGKPMDQSRQTEVIAEMYRRTAEGLKTNSVVVDGTFTNSSHRQEFLEFARVNGAEKIQGVLADVPVEIAKERNLKRERVVREVVIDRKAAELQSEPPKLTDGFDAIFTVDEFQRLLSAEGEETRKEWQRPH